MTSSEILKSSKDEDPRFQNYHFICTEKTYRTVDPVDGPSGYMVWTLYIRYQYKPCEGGSILIPISIFFP